MEEIICDNCGKEFRRKKSQLKLAVKHYCSISCMRMGSRKGKIVKCFECKKSIYKSLKDLNLSKSGKYFCGHVCSNKWIGKQQRAELNQNWTGGKASYNTLLKRTDIKRSCLLCDKGNPVILCVHHIDKDRKNNQINNLVWLCYNCHFLVHNYSIEKEKLSNKLHDKKM